MFNRRFEIDSKPNRLKKFSSFSINCKITKSPFLYFISDLFVMVESRQTHQGLYHFDYMKPELFIDRTYYRKSLIIVFNTYGHHAIMHVINSLAYLGVFGS